MKIMQINVTYKSGSTGKIVYDLHNSLINNQIDSVVCYGRGRNISERQIYKAGPEWLMKLQSLQSRITGYIYGGCFISTKKVIRVIQKEKPDVVHLHCLNGYFVNIYRLLSFLKVNKIKTLLTLHAEFMYTAGCSHSYECEQWKTGCCEGSHQCPQFNKLRPKAWFFNKCQQEWNLMKDTFYGFDNLIICPVSDWLKDKAIESSFMKDKKIKTVTNGLDKEVFKPTSFDQIKQKYSLHDEKIILHVTPDFLSEIKGGKYVLDIANRFVKDDVKVIIVGFNGDEKELPQNVIAVSHIKDSRELAAYYSIANLTLLTSKNETFSMVCAESLACGTPVVGFEAGAPETVAIKRYSEFVKQGNTDELEFAIRMWLNKKQEYSDEISNEARKLYSKDKMYEEYFSLYLSLLEGGN
jgi:glycosyltransferase involved in cell wall biosynthesis